MAKRSPLAPAAAPAMPAIDGVRLAACEAGIRYRGRTDLMLAELAPATTVAGVLTRSKTASAPVSWCRTHLPAGRARALVVNSGNANAFTGRRGDEAVRETAKAAAAAVGCDEGEVFVASTGVIGEPLDAGAFAARLADLHDAAGPERWGDAAGAIMTTDTYPKLATRTATIDGVEITLNGFAKGSGMIAPDMATMLAFVFTDAAIAAPALREMLASANETSFNAITIDGDTSTSDTLLAFATGAGEARGAGRILDPGEPRAAEFRAGLADLLQDLAIQVVKDGEGASKFITVTVSGAANEPAARRIAFSIANSPLVKTAIAGEDPNWGRVVMAVGKAGEAADRDKLAIWFGDVLVAERGQVAAGYREEAGAAYMKNPELAIRVDVGVGSGTARVYTCDLTHDYIAINADYRS